ncbi:MAG: Crp/Fnr family transcriptional regulator [Hyphomicrobiaceae bacterium]|nr:Crp/Fnr family transcriptional regulator [Hyphomicrobiaceae bacterium]
MPISVFAESLALAGLEAPLAEGLMKLARPVALAAGEVLFMAGDPGDGFYAIRDGSVKVVLNSADGGEQLLAVMGPGMLVGEMAILDGEPRSATVIGLKKAELSFVSRADFERFGDSRPELYRHMLKIVSNRLRQANTVLAARSFLPLPGRVALALLQLADDFGKALPDGRVLVHYKVSQSDIAGMVGAARENVSRVLNDWKREGLVTRLSGYYCLNDPKALEAFKAI